MATLDSLLSEAADRLRSGGLVVIPTETVYGLAADADNPAAVAAIFALKGRPTSRPLIVHIASADALDDWAQQIPEYARALARTLWPGPLTLVLPRAPRVTDAVTGGQDTVALRVPAHPLTLALLERCGGGLAAPSANRYGHISPTTPDHVRAEFGDATPLLLDGGPCAGGIESTIVACLDETPCVLRPGLVSAERIAAITGLPVMAQPAANARLRTAGQDLSHYAPRTPALMISRRALTDFRPASGVRAGFLGFAAPGLKVVLDLRLPLDPDTAAPHLYAALHRLDAADLDLLVIEAPPDEPGWAGIRDRLQRATARPTRNSD